MPQAILTVIIPCLNEEKNLPNTMQEVLGALTAAQVQNYEVLIFNDGSSDGTGALADAYAKSNARIRAVHNKPNRGFGYNYAKGVELAQGEYVMMIPGDNEHVGASVEKMFGLIGTAPLAPQALPAAGAPDIVIPYVTNTYVRPWRRRVVSKLFTMIMNALFGLKLSYFNGPCIIKKSLLLNVPLQTYDFAYMAVTLVRLIKMGASYVELGTQLRPRGAGSSSAFKPKNIAGVLRSIIQLFWEVHGQGRWTPKH